MNIHRYKYGKLVVVDSRIYCLSSSGCEVLDVDHDEAEAKWMPVAPSNHQPDSVAVVGTATYSVSRGRAEVYRPDQGQASSLTLFKTDMAILPIADCWSSVASMTDPNREWGGAVSLNGLLYIVGG